MNDNDIAALLPWYVNESLTDAEKAAVDELLQRSEDARRELLFLQGLAQKVRAQELPPVSELGWQRLKRTLDAQTQTQSNATAKAAKSWWRPGMAAAATLLIALQVGLLVKDNDAADIRLLSGGPVTTEQAWVLQLEFSDKSTWLDITQLLSRLDARLIDGPSTLGIVRIAVPKAVLSDSGQTYSSVTDVIRWLQQQEGIVHVAVDG
jgi:hypothetical protein